MSFSLLDGVRVVGVFVMIALNGFFVAAEFALVTVRWTRVEEMVEEGKFGALMVREAVEKIDGTIAATQLGITFTSLALGWIGEPALVHIVEPLFAFLPPVWNIAASHAVALAVSFLLLTLLPVRP